MTRLRSLAVPALVLAVILGASQAGAQGGVWVQVERREQLTGGKTADQVKHDALYAAIADAVGRVAGVKVQGSELSTRTESHGGIDERYVQAVRLDAAGRAIEWQVVRDAWKTEKSKALGEQVYYELVLRVNVEREQGTRDPAFEAHLALNAKRFTVRSATPRDNDEVIATVSTTSPANITIVSIVDDSVTLLVPNDVMGVVQTRSGASIEVPTAGDRGMGVHFRVTLPAGVGSRTQIIAMVATRKPVPVPSTGGVGAARDSRTLSLAEFNRWLVGIPLEDRAVAQAALEVQRAP